MIDDEKLVLIQSMVTPIRCGGLDYPYKEKIKKIFGKNKCAVCSKKASQYITMDVSTDSGKNYFALLMVFCHKHRILKEKKLKDYLIKNKHAFSTLEIKNTIVMTPRQWKDTKVVMDIMDV